MVHEADTHLQTKRHGLIPAHKLLTILWNTLHSSSGEDIEISEEDRTVYQLLEAKISQIDLALKYINSHKVEEHMDAGLKVWNSNRAKKRENFRFFAIYVTVPDQTFAKLQAGAQFGPDGRKTVRTSPPPKSVILDRTS